MANSTLLAIVRQFARRQSLTMPASVTGSRDETILQVWGILNEEVEDLGARAPQWKELSFKIRFNHFNGPDYLALPLDGATPRIKFPRFETLWSNDLRLPVAGPMSPQQWQAMLHLQTQPAQYLFRYIRDGLYIYPVAPPPTGGPGQRNFDMEYATDQICYIDDGVNPITYYTSYTADSAVCLMPDIIVMAGLTWRYRASKGFPYAEDQRRYEELIAQLFGQDGNAGVVHMDTNPAFPQVVTPGILVPAGNWNQ
jgi:hypothetical protein